MNVVALDDQEVELVVETLEFFDETFLRNMVSEWDMFADEDEEHPVETGKRVKALVERLKPLK